MNFSKPVITTRGTIKTTTEALRFIERQLPIELRGQSRWTFAHALLVEAERTEKKRDLTAAYRQFKQALENDRLSREDEAGPAAR